MGEMVLGTATKCCSWDLDGLQRDTLHTILLLHADQKLNWRVLSTFWWAGLVRR